MTEGRCRPAWAEIDPGAISHNAALLCEVVQPSALCAVVKADAYGHGAVTAARAALEGGARSLAVALVDEGVELRDAGISEPILVLSEPPLEPDASEALVAGGLTATVATTESVALLAAAARSLDLTVRVHVKIDTGMHRVGIEPFLATALGAAISNESHLELEGMWTHLAVADGTSPEDRSFTEHQLRIFDETQLTIPPRTAGPGPGPGPAPVPFTRHAANSAGAIAWPNARYDMVRCGIALYGHVPSAMVGRKLADATDGRMLRPALSLKARVSAVRELDAGERPSYGRRRPLAERSWVATVPIGYADGVPRALLDAGYAVLIGGRRCPLAGAVTMDQIMVDCGPNSSVSRGDVVTLLGRDGTDEITVSEWARLLDTIEYEVLCGIGPRVPRIVAGSLPGRDIR